MKSQEKESLIYEKTKTLQNTQIKENKNKLKITVLWSGIHWTRVERSVLRLQRKIAEAAKRND